MNSLDLFIKIIFPVILYKFDTPLVRCEGEFKRELMDPGISCFYRLDTNLILC